MSVNENSKEAKYKEITETLVALVEGSADKSVLAAAAMTTDGFIMGSALRDETNDDIFAAMNASLLVLAQRASSEMLIGDLKQVMMLGTEGVMHLTHIGSDAVLAIATDVNANMGKVVLESRRISVRIQHILESVQD